LLISDLHLDSDYLKSKRLIRHLNQALEFNAKILIGGDTFDAMQSKKDPRNSSFEQRHKSHTTAYFNDILEKNYEFLKPYKSNIEFLAYGNHETKIIQHNDIDLLDILADKLGCKKASYAGFIRFNFEHEAGGRRANKILYYEHGAGGDAPVTKGVIESMRQLFKAWADIYWLQHNHNRYDVDNEVMYINNSGNICRKSQSLIRTGTYKEEYSKHGHGFMIERGNVLKPIGGYWLNFYVIDNSIVHQTIKTD
jgi:hypothetical protein